MFWDMADDAADSLSELLQNPSATVKDVLNESNMLQEFRTGNDEITQYFSREDVIKELCAWSMTLSHADDSDFMHLSRLSTEVLICGGSNYAKTLCNSLELKKFFNEFLNDDSDEWDSFCVGHFQKVLVNLLKQGNNPKEFLNEFPSMEKDLAKHLNVIAVDELVIFLELEYSNYFDFIDVIAGFIEKGDGNMYKLVYSLRQIFERGWDTKENVRSKLGSKDVIERIVKGSKCITDKLTSIEILRLLLRIREKSPEVNKLLNEHSSEFLTKGIPQEAHDSFSMANVCLDSKEILKMLCDEIHWSLVPKFLNRLYSLPKDEFLAAVRESDLINKIIQSISNNELKPQYLSLIKVIYSYDQTLLDNVSMDVVSKALTFETSYGGELPIGTGQTKVNAE